jgi:hypothetical protein
MNERDRTREINKVRMYKREHNRTHAPATTQPKAMRDHLRDNALGALYPLYDNPGLKESCIEVLERLAQHGH